MTNSKTTQCGIYEISEKVIRLETDLSKEEIQQLLNKFIECKKIKYNKQTNEIYIVNWVKYNPINNINIEKCVLKELEEIEDQDFIRDFIETCITLGYKIPLIKQAYEGLIRGLYTPTKKKEKEEEKEEEKEQEEGPDLHHVDKIVDNSEDNLIKELSIHYENCFRKLIVPIHVETLVSFINDGMELDLVKTIMEYSSTKEDPFAYCRKVLNNCMGRKIFTKADFELNLKTKPSSKVQQATNRFTNTYTHNWDFDELEKLEMEYIDKKVAEMNGG